MRAALVAAMWDRGGVISRDEALSLVSHHIIDRALQAETILRPFPRTYVLAELAANETVVKRAALTFVRDGALSHTTALRASRLPFVALDDRLHVTTKPGAQVRGGRSLVVHRRSGFVLGAPQTLSRGGLPVVRVEAAIIESWPLLRRGEERAPAIAAVREGHTTAERLLATLGPMTNVAGRAAMRTLFELLGAGCHSELELWGHDVVFGGHGLPDARLQHVVPTEAGAFILDRTYLEEMVGVELDGAAWHGSPAQRERDLRRDAALAAAGWLIVRFSHRRLTQDPAGCREQLRRILATRRR